MATPRETLKYYFRKYALPTEEQFGELIDAFVHKDEDMLTQEKIDGLTAALGSKLSNEDFATAQAALNSAIEALQQADTTTAERLTTIEDDVATNADNIAGTALRVSSLESTVQEIVDGGGSGGGSDTNLYVKQIADLDTYEGTTGEIVQYIGTTTQSFTRGFFYERKEGEEGGITVTVTESSNPEYYPVGDYITQDPDGFEATWTAVFVDGTRRSITGTLYHYHGPTGMEYWTHMAPDAINQNGFVILAKDFNTINYSNTFPATATSTTSTPASWQVIPVGPCVN